DDRGQPALAHFGKRVVETAQQLLVEAVGPVAESGADGILEWREFAAAEDSDIVDVKIGKAVELSLEPVAISGWRVGAEIGRIPGVGAGNPIGRAALGEGHTLSLYERARAFRSRRCGSAQERGACDQQIAAT